MKKVMLIAAIAALAMPAVANAQFGLRLGLETPLYTHFDQSGVSGSYSIGDTFQPSITALIEHYPVPNIGIGLEAREGFLATGTQSCPPGTTCTGYVRTATNVGPNVTFDLVPVPIFLRGALPIHLEPGDVTINFRAAGGLKIGLPSLALYLEVTSDFPLAGGGVSAFSTQQLGAGAGLWFKL